MEHGAEGRFWIANFGLRIWLRVMLLRCHVPSASLGQDASLSFVTKIQPTDNLIGNIIVQFKEQTLT
jgi:hypothetical protein